MSDLLPVLNERSCGSCTQCCKVMGVVELEKAANVWCQHCTIGKGCGIYETRPESCREFVCLWLHDKEFPDEFRPDKSKVVLSVNVDSTAVVAYVSPEQYRAVEQGPMGRALRGVANKLPVIIVSGNKRRVLTTETGQVAFDEVQMDGTEVRYTQKAKP